MTTKYELKIMENDMHIISQMQEFRHDKSKSKMKDTILKSIDYNITSTLNEMEDIERIDVVINIHHADDTDKSVKKKVKRMYLYDQDKQ